MAKDQKSRRFRHSFFPSVLYRSCFERLSPLFRSLLPPCVSDISCVPKSCTGDVILYESHLAVYKHSLDLILYIIAGPSENELMLWSALQALSDALSMLLRNQLEKRGVLENLDLVVLCLDETIDDGCVRFPPGCFHL
jgi:Clathrin adaptor complex small chain